MYDNLYLRSNRSELMARKVAWVRYWKNGTKRREAGRLYRRAGGAAFSDLSVTLLSFLEGLETW